MHNAYLIKGICLTPANFDYPAEYQLPEAKRLRLEDGSAVEVPTAIAYPNTDIQNGLYYLFNF
jgi:hypothetical protein